MAIEVQGLEIQIGARTLLHPTNFHVAKGDKIGLVGRNGAGKTTLTRVITGDMLPTAGKVRVSGKLGYLPQDTHASDPTQTALDRMMSARDIATIINRIRKAEKDMTDPAPRCGPAGAAWWSCRHRCSRGSPHASPCRWPGSRRRTRCWNRRPWRYPWP